MTLPVEQARDRAADEMNKLWEKVGELHQNGLPVDLDLDYPVFHSKVKAVLDQWEISNKVGLQYQDLNNEAKVADGNRRSRRGR